MFVAPRKQKRTVNHPFCRNIQTLFNFGYIQTQHYGFGSLSLIWLIRFHLLFSVQLHQSLRRQGSFPELTIATRRPCYREPLCCFGRFMSFALASLCSGKWFCSQARYSKHEV
ncbi:hypothetical protein CKAN_00863700 [Cinnamomum micranthum f. kanehirae]|uniref:Uncharacterized protein n=1 Tax=Cinnamomum micranthum f. kanehirae TaxID=337451 RepID=A0A3S3N3E8_9MAGN|nr:hypothetical protein CKAN_00863700 [Cinnamomum micranthum f. kanehirae]